MRNNFIYNGFGVSLVAVILAFSSCSNGDQYFKDERYTKLIYIVSNDNQIFDADYNLTDSDTSVKDLTFGVSGTNPIDKSVTLSVERDSIILPKYDIDSYAEATDKYAHELSPAAYSFDQKTVSILAGGSFSDQIGKLPIRIKTSVLESLSPDSTYFIPLQIKDAAPYPINEDKDDVLYRIYKKNAFASQKTATYYTAEGYIGNSSYSLSKLVRPITYNEIRLYVGSEVFSATDTKDIISDKSAVITVDSDSTVTVSPWDKNGTLEVETLTPSKDPNDPSGSYAFQNVYKTSEKCFYIYYRYRNSPSAAWQVVREQLKAEDKTSN